MIKTERLLLRRWQNSDLDSLAAILGDADVMRFSDNGPLNRAAREAWLARAQKPLIMKELPGVLAIEMTQSKSVIGYVSLLQDLARVAATEGELGFRLARPFWGQGYATEAAAAIIDTAQTAQSISRVVATVDPHNSASTRVLLKLGMTLEREVMFVGYDYPDHFYALSVV